MIRKTIVIFMVLAGMVFLQSQVVAQDATLANEDTATLGIWADVSYVSKYIYRGVDFQNDNAAWQPSIYFDLFQTGFSLGVWASLPEDSVNEGATELDFNPSYTFSIFDDEAYKSVITLDYWYFTYPRVKGGWHENEDQNAQLIVKMPKLLQFGDIKVVPMYFYCTKWPTYSNLAGDYGVDDYNVSGYFHVLRLNTMMPIPDTEKTLTFQAETVYRGDVYGRGYGFSHVQLSASTGFDMGNGFVLTPGIYHQISIMDSVNTEDEWWTQLSLSKSF
ncbi:MAG: hypothetical protein JW745_01925 [Sedimentisphaerales bacterium]|nr:hypothetical protein [Sedimentisphaerales bacterium]MBN2841790.1 hypothetical protein [Sedimentisphaerales bacterium]